MTTATSQLHPPRQSPAYRKKYSLDRNRGIRRIVPATRAATQVQELVDAGASIRAVADASGVASTVVHKLATGTAGSVSRSTETRILAVRLDDVMSRSNADGFVPNIGARRRVQALMVAGWTHEAMHAHCGIRTAVLLHQTGRWISRRKHDAIAAMYDDLWATPGPSDVTRSRAAAAGYVGSGAWDDDTIDDPRATPDTGAAVHGIDLHEAVYLIRCRETLEQVAARLGVTEDAITTAARRSDDDMARQVITRAAAAQAEQHSADRAVRA